MRLGFRRNVEPNHETSWRQNWRFIGIVLVISSALLFLALYVMSGAQVGQVFSGVSKGIGISSTSSSSATPVASATTGNASTASNNSGLGRMVIRNLTLSVISEDVEKTLFDVRNLATAQQGIVSSSSSNVKDDKTYATLVFQIPSASYESTVNQLRKIAFKVESENGTSQDVTEKYVDVESEIRNLKVTEAQFLELMKKAKDVTETLNIQKELSNVRNEIEKRQGRINFLQNKSDLATITVNISPKPIVVAPPKPVAESWDFGEVLSKAWDGSVRGLQKLATGVTTILVYGFWIIPLILILVLFIRALYRRFFGPRLNPTSNGEV